MAKVSKIKQSLNAGELSPLMDARVDQAKYEAGCRTLENFVPLIYGGVKRRPGTEYIATQKNTTAAARLVGFERSVDNVYVLSFENQIIRIFKSGDRVMNTSVSIVGVTLPSGSEVSVEVTAHGFLTGDTVRFDSVGGTTEIEFNGNHSTEYQITRTDANNFTLDGTDGDNFTTYTSGGTVASIVEIVSPYLTADLPNLKIEHSADVMYITGSSYESRKLSRTSDTAWTLEFTNFQNGPFRPQNTKTTKTIVANGTTGIVTLTAVGGTPFDTSHVSTSVPISAFADYSGTVTGTVKATTSSAHGLSTDDLVTIWNTTSYNGQFRITKVDADEFYFTDTWVADDAQGSVAANTAKAQTGSLFKLIQAAATSSVSAELDTETADNASGTLLVPKGVTWDFTTNGTWGAANDSATVVLERSYDSGTTYETVVTVTSAANKNTATSGTEDFADAIYRTRVSSVSVAVTDCSTQFSIRDTSRTGIVEITAVASSTSATGIVLSTLASTDKTHRYAEGAWNDLRGWPKTVSISPEDRIVFAGSVAEPLSVWGSAIGDFTNMTIGSLDTDAYAFTLVGSGQQNEIQWSVPKRALVFGTVGGEHIFGASSVEEAVTPTNVQAKLQTTYGSENIRAEIVNQAILFVQRGGKKIREFLYSFDQDAHKADDLTVFSEHITGTGITSIAFQRTPIPMLWCIRADGQMAVMTYERDQNIFSWYRIVSDGSFESVAVVYGGERAEDEVWVTVKRNIEGTDTRYIERFKNQNWEQLDEAMMLDSAIVLESIFDAQNIILASDTVRCGEGSCNSSRCGGVIS
ncbi:MAG: hypothetical protein KAS32_10780 [Candidatus Peribacteraceae bacterium]|nr:hypothetical protein [Candidatus Peribacteraceae bacterium]